MDAKQNCPQPSCCPQGPPQLQLLLLLVPPLHGTSRVSRSNMPDFVECPEEAFRSSQGNQHSIVMSPSFSSWLSKSGGCQGETLQETSVERRSSVWLAGVTRLGRALDCPSAQPLFLQAQFPRCAGWGSLPVAFLFAWSGPHKDGKAFFLGRQSTGTSPSPLAAGLHLPVVQLLSGC